MILSNLFSQIILYGVRFFYNFRHDYGCIVELATLIPARFLLFCSAAEGWAEIGAFPSLYRLGCQFFSQSGKESIIFMGCPHCIDDFIKIEVVIQSVAAANNDVPFLQLQNSTNGKMGVITPIFLHSELIGVIKTMLLLNILKNANELLKFANHHKSTVYI